MAVEIKEQEEEQQEPGAMNISAQSSQIGSGAAPSAQPKGASKGGSGSFTNIKEYVQANKPKTQQMSEGITGQVRKEGQQLGEGLSKEREKYLGQSGQFGEGAQQFVQEQIQTAGQQPTGDPSLSYEEGKAAKQQRQAQQAANLQRFRDYATGATKAPDLSKQRQQAADLQRRGQQYQTSKGRFEALQKLVGRDSPTYTKGQRQLDNLLLGGDRQSRLQGIRDVRQATQGLAGDVGRLEQDIGTAREGLKQAAGGADTARQELFNTAQGGADEYNRRRQDLLDFLQGRDTTVDQATADQFGLQAGQQVYGLHEGLSGLASDRTMQQQMTPEQFARAEALSRLSGRPLEFSAPEQYESIDDIRSRLAETTSNAKSAFEGEISGVDQGLYATDLALSNPAIQGGTRIGQFAGSPDGSVARNASEQLHAQLGALGYSTLAINRMTVDQAKSALNDKRNYIQSKYYQSGPVNIV